MLMRQEQQLGINEIFEVVRGKVEIKQKGADNNAYEIQVVRQAHPITAQNPEKKRNSRRGSSPVSSVSHNSNTQSSESRKQTPQSSPQRGFSTEKAPEPPVPMVPTPPRPSQGPRGGKGAVPG